MPQLNRILRVGQGTQRLGSQTQEHPRVRFHGHQHDEENAHHLCRGKTKRRLSSLFSSNSLSSHLNDDREGSASPRRGSSVLHPSTSTSGSSSPLTRCLPESADTRAWGAPRHSSRCRISRQSQPVGACTPVNGKSSVTESPQGLSPVSPLQMRNDTVPQPGGVASTARALSSFLVPYRSGQEAASPAEHVFCLGPGRRRIIQR